MTTKIHEVVVLFTVTPEELRNIERRTDSISEFEDALLEIEDVTEVEFDDDDTFRVVISYEKDMNTVKEQIKAVGMQIIEAYTP